MSAYVVGLTGQTGAGKTTVSNIFSQCGFYIINCDIIARKVTEDGSDTARELEKEFPDFFDNGCLNRRQAAKMLFSDRELLDRYNAAIFPMINRLIEQNIKAAEEKGYRFVLLDAPTLFEAGADRLCNAVVSCTADTDKRIKRITERDGLTEEEAIARIRSQHSEDFFRDHSDYLIENNKTKEELAAAAFTAAKTIKERYNGK